MTIITEKKHWPKGGTTLAVDLGDLWDKFEDQASIFVAEALIHDPPHAHIDLEAGEIETFLWTVGDDVVCLREALSPMMEDAIVEISDGDQRKELLECWQRLQKAIDKVKERSGN